MEYICPEKNCVYDSDEVQCTCGDEEKTCIQPEVVGFAADDFQKENFDRLDAKLIQPGFTEISKNEALELIDTLLKNETPRRGKKKKKRSQAKVDKITYLKDIKDKISKAAVSSWPRCYPIYFEDEEMEEQKDDGHITRTVRAKRGSTRYEDIPATRCDELTQLNPNYNIQRIWADDLNTSLEKNLADSEEAQEEKNELYRKAGRNYVPTLYHGTHSCGPELKLSSSLYAYPDPNNEGTKYLRASSLDGAKERLKILYSHLSQNELNPLLEEVVLNKNTPISRRAQYDNKEKEMATFINPKCGYGWIRKIDRFTNSIKSRDNNDDIVFKYRLDGEKPGWTLFDNALATRIEDRYHNNQVFTLSNKRMGAKIVWTPFDNFGNIRDKNNKKIGEVKRELTNEVDVGERHDDQWLSKRKIYNNWDEYAQECVNPRLYCYPKLTGTLDDKEALKDSFKKLHRLNTCVADREVEEKKMSGSDMDTIKNHKEVLASYKYIRERCRKDIERALEEDKDRSLIQPSCDEGQDPDSNCLHLVPYIVRKSGGNKRFKYLINTCGSRTNLLADLPDNHSYQNTSKWNQLWNDKRYLERLGTIFTKNLDINPIEATKIRTLLTNVSRGTVAIKKDENDALYVTKLIGDKNID